MASKLGFQKLPWNRAHPSPVVLISGPEKFLINRAFSSIKHELVTKDPTLQQHQLQADTYAAGELITFASPSLFGEPRLIDVSGVEKSNDQFIKEARAYLQAPDSDTTLVLRHAGGVRGKALLDAIRKSEVGAIEILCPEVKPNDKRQIARDEFKRLGGRIDQEAFMPLLEAYQDDLEELMSVIKQLVSVSGGNVTQNHVEYLTEGRVEAGAFRVADAAIGGNSSEAIVLLRQALSTGTSGIPILGALNLKVRTMAKVMGSYGPAGQSAKQFGVAPWQIERAQRDISGWREVDLARAVDMGAETELKMKGGSRDPIYALEKYVLFVARRGK